VKLTVTDVQLKIATEIPVGIFTILLMLPVTTTVLPALSVQVMVKAVTHAANQVNVLLQSVVHEAKSPFTYTFAKSLPVSFPVQVIVIVLQVN